MSGWKRIHHRGAVETKTFWLHYGLCLAQVLVLVAYFLPWELVYGDLTYKILINWAYSRLTHDLPTNQAFFMVSLITCFMASIASFLITVFMLAMNRRYILALRASSSLTSLAVVGPLLYIHHVSWPDGLDLSNLSPAIGEMASGWFIALFSGSAAFLLTLYMYHVSCKSVQGSRNTIRPSLARLHRTPLVWVSILIVVFGCVITAVGFFLTWNSGSAYIFWGDRHVSYSISGFETSPLMYLVPIAAVLSSSLLILSLFTGKVKNPVSSQAVLNILIVAFALTLFWGLAFGEYRFFGVDLPLSVAKLQVGWYLCVIGQSIILAFMLLVHRVRSAALINDMALPSKSISEPTP